MNQIKDSEREENKRRHKRRDIITLGPSGGFCWWSESSVSGRVQRGLPILLAYPSGDCHPSSGEQYCHGSSWNESVGAGESWLSQNPPLQSWPSALHKHLTFLPTWHVRGIEVAFTRQHPTSTRFHLPATVPYQVRKFACERTKYTASLVSLLDLSISISVSQDRYLQQLLTPTWGSTRVSYSLGTNAKHKSTWALRRHVDVDKPRPKSERTPSCPMSYLKKPHM